MPDTYARVTVRNTCENMTPIIRKVLEDATHGTTIVLEKQTYHFYDAGTCHQVCYPSNNMGGEKHIVFPICGKKELTIEGNGAELIFHGTVFPFVLKNCEAVEMRDFSVDFASPRVYQAMVIASGEEFLDIRIDKVRFPYSLKNGKLVFHLEDMDIAPDDLYFFPYDAKRGHFYGKMPTRYNMAHFHIGSETECANDPRQIYVDAREMEDGVLRLYYRPHSNRMFYLPQDRLVLAYHGERTGGTFFLENCKNVTFENVAIWRGGCMGLCAQLCENIKLHALHIGCKQGRGDLVSTTADALMFIDCAGNIELTDSYIADSLDDGMNVHGTYTKVESIRGNVLLHALQHREQAGFLPLDAGERIAIADGKTLEVKCICTVAETQLLDDGKHILTMLAENPEGSVQAGDWVYDLDKIPELKITDNTFSNVPALLIGTSKPSVFARNTVNTRNEALRLGDSATGCCEYAQKKDLVVADNTFLHCAEWYDLPIIHIIERAEIPVSKTDIHQDMIFRNNRFIGSNGRYFYIEHSQNVEIIGNTFEDTRADGAPKDKNAFEIFDCDDVRIHDNRFLP